MIDDRNRAKLNSTHPQTSFSLEEQVEEENHGDGWTRTGRSLEEQNVTTIKMI